ncbi:hypothetical protein SLS62_005966 [Diatrype stigma]|uniref:Uncharacterized protein n=1 Tax=Diatrype stigma TaxID=117547 RepID=A0AAN9UN69_9PEZI
MAASFFKFFGVVQGGLGVIQFGKENFAKPNAGQSTIRIAVGLDVDGGLSNAGGKLPDVRLFNEAGDFLGIEVDPGTVESGGFADINVTHAGDSTQQATYALFSANDDAICIAYAAITWPGGDTYSWIGDWGHKCGGSWYYSNYFISGNPDKPDCLWIDKNNDSPQTGFQVHWPEFSIEDSGYTEESDDKDEKIDYLCNAGPPFKMHVHPDEDPNSITLWSLSSQRSAATETGTSYGPSKHPKSARFQHDRHHPRSNGTDHSGLHFKRLVMDDNPKHTGRDLCENPMSLGPDYVSVYDWSFCRMSDKTLWPVCRSDVTDDCFNTDLKQLIVGGVAARGSPYESVLDWTSGHKA